MFCREIMLEFLVGCSEKVVGVNKTVEITGGATILTMNTISIYHLVKRYYNNI
jgi:hypothetical protein